MQNSNPFQMLSNNMDNKRKREQARFSGKMLGKPEKNDTKINIFLIIIK